MAKRYSTEETASMITNDDFEIGEMDSDDSLDEDSSPDDEPSSDSEIGSNDNDTSYSDRQVLVNKRGREDRKRSWRIRGGLRRGATIRGGLGRGVRARGSVRRGVRTRGGLTRQPSNTMTGKRNRDDLQDDCPSENESPNWNYEQPVNRDLVNVDNPVDDNTNGNDEDGESSEEDWSDTDPELQVFHFNENEGLNIPAAANDDPHYDFSLFMMDELWNEPVGRSNEYAHSVINSSCLLGRRSVLNIWKDVTVTEIKQFIRLVFHIGLVAMPT